MPRCEPRKGIAKRLDVIEGIKKGLASMKSGKGRDAAQFFAELRKKMGIPPK